MEKEFSKLPLHEKKILITDVINNEIKPMLSHDGGSLDIIDIKENKDKIEVYIEYQGACYGCPYAKTSTLNAIQNYLQMNISESIVVIN